MEESSIGETETLRQVENEFERILGPRHEHTIVESLLCTTALSIVQLYPTNRHRQLALASMLDVAYHIKSSEKGE